MRRAHWGPGGEELRLPAALPSGAGCGAILSSPAPRQHRAPDSPEPSVRVPPLPLPLPHLTVFSSAAFGTIRASGQQLSCGPRGVIARGPCSQCPLPREPQGPLQPPPCPCSMLSRAWSSPFHCLPSVCRNTPVGGPWESVPWTRGLRGLSEQFRSVPLGAALERHLHPRGSARLQ